MLKDENYTKHLIAGLVLTLLVLAGFTFFIFTETGRIEKASASYTNESIQHGREVFAQQCSTCHGNLGEGGVGPALNNKQLLKNTYDDVFFSVIRSGVPSTQMPAWSVDFGGPLTDQDIHSVVAFIRAWEATAPEIKPEVFVPSPERGALLFATVCENCHGANGLGGENVPAINDSVQLSALDDDWYRGVIRNGLPSKGMPTWGAALSSNQIEDLVSLMDAWRNGEKITAAFSISDLLGAAVYSLQNDDPESASLQVSRAISVAEGYGAELLSNAAAQIDAGDNAGALASLETLSQQWPLGDPALGAESFATSCSKCHGANGEGQGIFPQLHPNEFIQSLSNAELVAFVLKGRAGTAMAGFDGRLSETEIANIVAFLRTWQP